MSGPLIAYQDYLNLVVTVGLNPLGTVTYSPVGQKIHLEPFRTTSFESHFRPLVRTPHDRPNERLYNQGNSTS